MLVKFWDACLDFNHLEYPILAPNGLAVIVMSISYSATCYSWNHNTAQFDPIYFNDQVHIRWNSSSEYSADGEIFACRSDDDSHVRVWDIRTGQLVSKFPMSEVYGIVLSPALIDHFLGGRHSLLLGSHVRTQYASLIPITLVCMVNFWVKQMHIWRL